MMSAENYRPVRGKSVHGPSPAEPASRKMRVFILFRAWDATGVSGTGVVAEGVQFSDGTCVLHWLTEHTSTGLYSSIADVQHIHGHGGSSRVEWCA